MKRACALLTVITALLFACGKYGPPRRVRPEPPATTPTQLEVEAESPGADEGQEEDQ